MAIQIFPKASRGDPTLATSTTKAEGDQKLVVTASSSFSFVRTNGWTRPRHYFQTIGWACFLLFTLVDLLVLVPNLPARRCLQAPILAVNMALAVCHIAFNLIATGLNPIDDLVLATRTQLRPAKFDRSKHRHVIENQFCYICESVVGAKSKHCSLCNKCVANFDHHCKWLNNCVGGKNYLWFVLSMLTALGQSLAILGTCIALLVDFYVPDEALGEMMDENGSGETSATSTTVTRLTLIFCMEVENGGYVRLAWAVGVWVTMVMAAFASLLLMHLCGFHIFLAIVDMSTYEFVMRQRSAEQALEAERAVAAEEDENDKDIEKAKAKSLDNGTLRFFKQCLPRRLAGRRISTATPATTTKEINGGSGANPSKFTSVAPSLGYNKDASFKV